MLVNQDLASLWSAFYRYAQAYSGRFHDFFESNWVYLFYFIYHLFIYAVFGLAFSHVISGEEAKEQFLLENPDLMAYTNEAIICFPNRKRTITGACILFVM